MNAVRQPIDQSSYEQTLKALSVSQRGSYGDLSYMPVFRASAIFYALCGADINTRVGFLNYWREKNGLHNIGVLVTVRDAQGIKQVRQYSRLMEATGHYDLAVMLGSRAEFSGSIELEFFSSEDLKFQFPGVTVFYQTPAGVSYVHTNQRVYNNAEDKARGCALNAWQTGFDVVASRGAFVYLVNGPSEFQGGAADLVAINADGRIHSDQIDLPVLAPYATHQFQPGLSSVLAAFLGDSPGMLKLNLPIQDIHLRLGVGHDVSTSKHQESQMRADVGRWLSVTHSFFDATGQEDFFSTVDIDDDVCPAFIPFVLPAHSDLDLVLYPIYSPCTMRLSLTGFDADGSKQFNLPLGNFQTPKDGVRRLDIRELLKQHRLSLSCSLFVLRFDSSDEQRLPNRITYGLNFHQSRHIGTNISASAYVVRSWAIGSRSWKWGAIVLSAGASNQVMVCAFKNRVWPAGADTAVGSFCIYDRTGLVVHIPFVLKNQTSQIFSAEELLDCANYAVSADAIVWYVVESPQAWLDVVGITVSAQGNVGGDHSF